MNNTDYLSELLINFRIFSINESKGEIDLLNLQQQIEKLKVKKNDKSFDTVINEIINVFVNTSRRKELVILLANTISTDDFRLCHEHQIESLMRWLKDSNEFSEIKEVVAVLCIYSNIVNANASYAKDISEKIIEDNYIEIVKNCLKNSRDVGFEDKTDILTYMDVIISNIVETSYIESLEEFGKTILDLHYGNLFEPAPVELRYRFVYFSITILSKICLKSIAFARNNVSEILGFIRAYWHYDVSTESVAVTMVKILPSHQYFQDPTYELEQACSSTHCGGKVTKTRKPKGVVKKQIQAPTNKQKEIGDVENIFNAIDVNTSESDTSENELATNRSRSIKLQKLSKLRLGVIILLGQLMTLQEKKVLFSYWHALFPSGLFETNDNLVTIAQNDTNKRCRAAALQVSAQLIYLSKAFLMQAESNQKSSNYLPFSGSLALDILALYKSYLNILEKEPFLQVTLQALKCIAVLVQATPFDQIEKGVVTTVINAVKKFIKHPDMSIQIACLMVMEFMTSHMLLSEVVENLGFPLKAHEQTSFESIINMEESLELDEEELLEMPQQDQQNYQKSNDCDASYWFLKDIMENLRCCVKGTKGRFVTSAVRIASFQVLTGLAAHVHLFYMFMDEIADILEASLEDTSDDVRLYAARCANSFAYQISQNVSNKTCLGNIYIEKCKSFWNRLLPVFHRILCSEEEQILTLKVAICDAISNIGEFLYEMQANSMQIQVISVLSGIALNEEALVSSAALRALAVFSRFESLRKDFVFIENIAELSLRLRKDSNIVVKIKATWSLANISDALVSNVRDQQRVAECISDNLLFRLMESTLEDCNGNDKIRCNAVRCLGNLIHLITLSHLEVMKFKCLVRNCIERLIEIIRASGNAKVKWNSCYAIRNLISNKEIFNSDLGFQESLYSTLCNTIVHHTNFKVRIHATSVILHIPERSQFGNFYGSFWEAVLNAIEQSNHLDNYFEYNHRDQLQEELCKVIVHLLEIAIDDDLQMIANIVSDHKHVLTPTWRRLINRIIPEKVASLLICTENLQKRIAQTSQLNNIQRKNIERIISVLQVE